METRYGLIPCSDDEKKRLYEERRTLIAIGKSEIKFQKVSASSRTPTTTITNVDEQWAFRPYSYWLDGPSYCMLSFSINIRELAVERYHSSQYCQPSIMYMLHFLIETEHMMIWEMTLREHAQILICTLHSSSCSITGWLLELYPLKIIRTNMI